MKVPRSYNPLDAIAVATVLLVAAIAGCSVLQNQVPPPEVQQSMPAPARHKISRESVSGARHSVNVNHYRLSNGFVIFTHPQTGKDMIVGAGCRVQIIEN